MKTYNISTQGKVLLHATLFLFLMVLFAGCKNSGKPPEKDVVRKPEDIKQHTTDILKKMLTYAGENKSRINDSVTLASLPLVQSIYEANGFTTIWSKADNWQPVADSLFAFIAHSKEYGLFPNDYHSRSVFRIKSTMQADSVSRRDAAMWTRADVLLTDAYLTIARHLKLGRLPKDSVTLTNDSLYNDAYFASMLTDAVNKNSVIAGFNSLEPKFPEYKAIREAVGGFLNSARFVNYTYIPFPSKDSALLLKKLQRRLAEEGFIAATVADTTGLSNAIKTFQEAHKMKPSGRISESLIRQLNNTDIEKFKKIAITLDRYKQLPDKLPKTHVMVNLPAFRLYAYSYDTLVFESKIIVGAPKTKTPLLTSQISNFITYPQWTVPYSIIFKEMLPKIQKDVHYLDKQNLMVVDRDDNVVDPSEIDWSSLSKKNFPYLLRQREGDDNSLGVIKFNFVNKYSVYLHDTNARSLFERSFRALSHGCVRVQEWETFSRWLVRADTERYPSDTLDAWMMRQEKHTVTGFQKVPLYIRYFTVEGQDGQLKFYDDIYGYDRVAMEKYFAGKVPE